MAFSYTKNKSELGEIENCWVCLEPIDLDSVIDGIPDCLICNNGHRLHRKCYNALSNKSCGICRQPIQKNCHTNLFGYGYVPRTGGKIKTRKSRKSRKSRKNRANKKKNTKKNYTNKRK